MRCAIFIHAACALFFTDHIYGQLSNNYTFRHITQRDGLISNTVYGILQDKRGFVWIGTDNGLQRYDGYRFVTYQAELNYADKSNISVGSLDLVGNNTLICGNKKLDLPTNFITHYTKEDFLKNAADARIFRGKGDTVWLTGNQLAYACIGGNTSAYNVARDSSNDQYWIVINHGLVLLDGKTKRAYTASDNPLHHSLLTEAAGITAKAIAIDSRHNIWFSTWTQQFFCFDDKTKKLKRYSLLSIKPGHNEDVQLLVNYILEDDHHTVWLATANAGLLKYDPQKDNFSVINADPDNSLGIQYNFEIFWIMQDREGNLWLGTDKGINIFNPYNQYFHVMRNTPGKENTLPQREITCVIQTKRGDILVGTWGGGIVVYNNQWQFKRKINFPGRFEENLVWCFVENNDGKIWIGCQHGYINVYDPNTGKTFTLHPDELQNSTIRCMTKDKDGNIFFGLHNGRIAEWLSKSQSFYPYCDSADDSKQKGAAVFNIFIDHQNNCWAATSDGFKHFNVQKRIFDSVYYPSRISSHACIGMEADNDTTLIVGMINGGVARFITGTKTFVPIEEYPLSTHTIHAIQKDRAGNIWLVTDYQLYKYLGKQKKIINYTIDPSIINTAFQSNNFTVLSDGHWVITTRTEVLSFYPDSLSDTKDAGFPVEIAGLKFFNRPIFVDSFLSENKTISLSNKQNFLTFEFTSLHFSRLRQVKYYYKLSGVNRDWVATEIPLATYTNLAPGHYTFFVRTDDESDNGRTAMLNFTIAPRFWQTWWFLATVIIAAGCIVYYLVKRRILIAKRELALKKQIQEVEMMALRAQMNPHFIFNCINSIDAMIQSNDKYHATTYLNKFAKLLRSVLDSSKENTVSLAKDLEALELYIQLEQFRNENQFTYEIKTEAGLLNYDIRVPPLVIQPYVENAIQHGFRYRNDNAGRLLVNISRQNGHLFYTIEDNGIGREMSAKFRIGGKKSYGMDMSDNRIKLFNKEDKTSVEIIDLLENGQPAGTRVTVGLKIDE